MKNYLFIVLASMILTNCAFAQEKPYKSEVVNEAIEKFDTEVRRLESLIVIKIRSERQNLIETMEAELLAATKAGDLEEAIKLRDAIKKLQEMQDSSAAEAAIVSGKESANKRIPKDAVKFGKSKYYYYTKLMSRNDAIAYCESLGGHLARMETIQEQAFLGRALVSAKQPYAWVDGSDESGKWIFSNGEVMPNLKWQPGEPERGKHYALFRGLAIVNGKDVWSMTLQADHPTSLRTFICEWSK